MALIIAPILFAASTFFWVNGEYGVAAATLGIVSLFFAISAFARAYGLLKKQLMEYINRLSEKNICITAKTKMNQ